MYQITPAWQQKLIANKAKVALRNSTHIVRARRDRYIDTALTKEGAIATLARIEKYGRTPDKDVLRLSPWVRDAIRLVADWRVQTVVLSGGAQLGKSLITYLVAADLLIEGRLSFGWIYPDDGLRQTDQPKFRKIAEEWLKLQREEFNPDRNNLKRFEIEGATGNFTHSNSVQKKEGAAHGSGGVSFTAHVLFFEECSQSRDVDYSGRLQASKISTKPQRPIGTPGSGSGIEKIAEACTKVAITCLECKSCGTHNPLHPYLLFLERSGDSFFSHGGKPKQMAHQFSCINCRSCLDDPGGEQAIAIRVYDSSLYRLLKEGDRSGVAALSSVSLGEELDKDEQTSSIALWLMPLMLGVADSKKWCADSALGLGRSSNVKAAIQERLGIASDITQGVGTNITQGILSSHYSHPAISKEKYRKYSGLDQGVDCHFLTNLIVVEDQDNTLIIERAVRISADDLPGAIEEFQPDLMLIDNEPDKTWALNLCNQFPGIVRAANQSTRKLSNQIVKTRSKSGGKRFECWDFDNQYWIGTTVDTLNHPDFGLLGLRVDGQLWDSPIDPDWEAHIRSIKRSSGGTWARPDDHEDDFFYSLMFAIVAMHSGSLKPSPIIY